MSVRLRGGRRRWLWLATLALLALLVWSIGHSAAVRRRPEIGVAGATSVVPTAAPPRWRRAGQAGARSRQTVAQQTASPAVSPSPRPAPGVQPGQPVREALPTP